MDIVRRERIEHLVHSINQLMDVAVYADIHGDRLLYSKVMSLLWESTRTLLRIAKFPKSRGTRRRIRLAGADADLDAGISGAIWVFNQLRNLSENSYAQAVRTGGKGRSGKDLKRLGEHYTKATKDVAKKIKQMAWTRGIWNHEFANKYGLDRFVDVEA